MQIAIGFANVNSNFTEQLERMLQHIPYIDDCDTLGQKAEEQKIHKALVSVYQKVIEFYMAICDILARKGSRLVMKMILENDRLPSIVQDFLRCSDILHNVVQSTTLRILQDIHSMLLDEKIFRWLGADKLKRQSQHHDELKRLRADQACDFVLRNPNFINWYRASDSQQLLILGQLGCGKSVLMSFLVEQLRQRTEYQIPQPKVCYYYCLDTETGNDTSIVSTLILELLDQLNGLKIPFIEWYKAARTSTFDPATNFEKLEEFLHKMLGAIDRPIFIVIDALDECDMESRDRLLEVLKSISGRTSNLKIVLSSRSQEEVLEQLDGTTHIDLAPNAERDGIIVDSLVEKKLSHISPDVKALIKENLSDLAQGNAMWTRMVVDLIRIRGVKAKMPMERFLKDLPLPHKLSKLYNDLLSRCTSNDPENLKLASIALKVLAITRRPLSMLELAWAVTLGANRHITTVGALA
ncbi:hypothetical protein PHISP_04047, partial [Aspergillus sp. HF37]